jgi:SHAQKYF class myb-like DNA-binding protein
MPEDSERREDTSIPNTNTLNDNMTEAVSVVSMMEEDTFADNINDDGVTQEETVRPTTTTSTIPQATIVTKNTTSPPTTTGKKRKTTATATTTMGRWNANEHEAFLQAVQQYGREWKKVAAVIPTRTAAQVRSHAQKYFWKLDNKLHQDDVDASYDSVVDESTTSATTLQYYNSTTMSSLWLDTTLSESTRRQAARIVQSPGTVQQEVADTLEQLRERYQQLQRRLQQALQHQQQDAAADQVPQQQQQQEQHRVVNVVVVQDGDCTNTTATTTRNQPEPAVQQQQPRSPEEWIALRVLQQCLPNSSTTLSEDLMTDTQ